jgi:outer membrane protein assembly factor BamE
MFDAALRNVRMTLLLAWPAVFAGCSAVTPSGGFLGLITPYRVEVVQGNVVTQEQVARVKVGMSRAQVRDILGSPLLADVFHADRWDYIFTIRRQGTAPQRHSIVALFDGERLASLDTGGELPGEEAFVASIDTAKPPAKAPALVLSDEQVHALKVPAKPPAAATAAQVPTPASTRTYPPLESR